MALSRVTSQWSLALRGRSLSLSAASAGPASVTVSEFSKTRMTRLRLRTRTRPVRFPCRAAGDSESAPGRWPGLVTQAPGMSWSRVTAAGPGAGPGACPE